MDVGPLSPQLSLAIRDVGTRIDREFERLLTVPQDSRERLYEAMRHATIGGGKRMRPLLVFATSRLFGNSHVARPAVAIECIHVYSLIHDDLPAMDDDDLRRGKPTVHKQFDEATAILAGDCLHALAFEILSDPVTNDDAGVRSELVLTLASAAGPNGMAGGQMMDLMAEGSQFDLPTVTRLQALKTGALISCAVEFGAIIGGLPVDQRTGLRGYAHDIGLAFQIVDDLLDVEGDEELAGKRLRKDGEQGKETFVSLLGADRAREQAAMLVEQAIEHLHPYGDEADLLRQIARYTLERDR